MDREVAVTDHPLTDSETCLVFNWAGSPPPRGDSESSHFTLVHWRPTLFSRHPAGDARPVLLVWWLFHSLRIFANRDYGQLVIYDGEKVIHRSATFPRWPRFPFMEKADLQIGDTWTHPEYRGRGLAAIAIREILHQSAGEGRTFWYIAAAENLASIKAAQRAGLRSAGGAVRRSRFGCRILGSFHLT